MTTKQPIVLNERALEIISRQRDLMHEIANTIEKIPGTDNRRHAEEIRQIADNEGLGYFDCFYCVECEEVHHDCHKHRDSGFCRACTRKLDKEAEESVKSLEQDYQWAKGGR